MEVSQKYIHVHELRVTYKWQFSEKHSQNEGFLLRNELTLELITVVPYRNNISAMKHYFLPVHLNYFKRNMINDVYLILNE